MVSECLNSVIPVLVILSCDGQFGSGHAMIESVVIQSCSWVIRCLQASRGRTDAAVSVSKAKPTYR